MQEMDVNEKDKIEDDSRIRQYFQIQLARSCCFEFKFVDRLQRYNRIADDLMSFEYMLTKHDPQVQWNDDDFDELGATAVNPLAFQDNNDTNNSVIGGTPQSKLFQLTELED